MSRRITIIVAMTILALALLATITVREPYPIDPRQPWGPSWGTERPPGLPATARRASTAGAALPRIRALAGDVSFARALVRLARNESGGRYALPASRPHPPTSGWGVWQYNRAAWRSLTRCRDCDVWDASPDDEVRLPIERHYRPIWRAALDAGATTWGAERAIRLWQISPRNARRYVSRIRDMGEHAAWTSIDYRLRSGELATARIDRRLGGVA